MKTDDAAWWLAQSLKREEAEEKVNSAFEQDLPVVFPPPSEWNEYPCDICAKPVGETGHINLTTVAAPEVKIKTASLQVRCKTCRDYLLRFYPSMA